VSTIAFALRPTVHSPKEIILLSKMLEEYSQVSKIFIPDIPGGLESIEIATAALSNCKRLHIGSGVLRILEHENDLFFRRLETIQVLSANRFILGVGTGSRIRDPKATIAALLDRLQALKSYFKESLEIKPPETYIATLKPGIAKTVAGRSNGIILNFCSPQLAKGLIAKYRESFSGPVDFACYLKVFYSHKLENAQKLMVSEFSKYDKIAHYHELFIRDMVANDIASSEERLQRGETLLQGSRLFEICLANPSSDELRDYVSKFRAAGITLPCIYPYFGPSEDFAFRSQTIRLIADIL
jgi:alkanesulfonate monooxygenase SsuD/methylene tetrahydromethanopterin reductase-like flavin-dependent oxidoreductase (luciferase family)